MADDLMGRIRRIVDERFDGVETDWAKAAGLSDDALSAIRFRVKRKPDAGMYPRTAAALAKAAGCRESWLLFGDGEPYAKDATAPSPLNLPEIVQLTAEVAALRDEVREQRRSRDATPAPPSSTAVRPKRLK